jgi:hypothetical protein
MKRARRTITTIVLLALAAVAIASIPIAQAGPPVCPLIYAPVICDGGKIYPNQCVADRHHAKNCVPYGL